MRPTNRPALPPIRKRVVAVPGHPLASSSYDQGAMAWQCGCGVSSPALPATTAAAHRYDHLETFMARSPMLAGEPFANAGKSIYELIWDEMDTVYDRLMQGEGVVAKGDKHYARGLAMALAILTNPYEPNIEAIKSNAHDRWEANTPDEDLETYAN